jgi:hypothetical protein
MPEEILPPSDAEFDAAPAHAAPPTDAEFNAAPEAKAPSTHFLDLPPEVQSEFAKSDPVATENDLRESWGRQDPQWKNPESVSKAAQVWKQLKAESPGAVETVKNLATHPLDTAGKVAVATGGFLKGVFKQGKTYLEAGGRAILRPIIEEITGTDVLSPERRAEMQRQIAENWAGTEESATGLMQGASTLGRKILEQKGLIPSPKDYSPEVAQADMFNDLAMQTQKEKIARGHGEFLSNPAIGGHVVKQLEEQGKPIRPEEVESRAAGDPFALAAFGGAMKGAGMAAKAITPKIVGKAGTALLGDLGDIGKTIVGKTTQGAGKAVELGGRAVTSVGGQAPLVGGLLGLGRAAFTGDPAAVLGPYFVGRAVRNVAGTTGRLGQRIGSGISELGEDIASNAPAKSNLAQLGRDVVENIPPAAAKTAEGAIFDVAFNQATEDLPAEKEQPLQIGTGLGAVGGLKGMAKRAVSGQLIAPRNTGSVAPVPSTRPYGGLSTAHNNAYANATPATQAFVNTARQLLRSVGAKADVFLAGPETDAELAKMGVSDQMRGQIAGNRAVTLRTKDGRSVVILNHPSDAPHEAMHAIDHAAGPEVTDALNEAVRKSYSSEEFNAILNHQSQLLGGEGRNVWEKILNATGAGNDAAKAKLREHMALADYMTKGEQISPENLDSAVDQIWNEHARDNPNAYKDFLSDNEIRGAAESYAASEIRAENFDALVKHTGSSLQEPKGIVPASARAIGKAMSLAGVNPIEGRTSEGQQYSLNKETIDQQREAVQKLQKVVTPEQVPTSGNKPVVSAETPVDNAAEARKIADEAPKTPAVEGGETQNEILGKVADAIASKGGVAIQHSGAPDEPAASITSNRTIRRAIIEAYRNVPQSARAMWPKTFFPNKIVRTGKGIQIQGWAPEVFSSNAQKMAEFFAKAGPENSPYEIDTNAKSLSEQGWKDFFKDVSEVAIPNYAAGRTASGVELQVPDDLVLRRGWTKPPLKPAAGKLDQAKADFINMAFGFRSPSTPRITSGKLPQNIAAQEVSRATIPGRVEETIRPRAPFAGKQAEALGIEGESIREVNPLVNKVANLAAQHNTVAPSLIEAWQNLNLENVKSAAHAPEQPEFRGNTAAVVSGFQPATAEAPRVEKKPEHKIGVTAPGQKLMVVEGPDGAKFPIRFDGYQETYGKDANGKLVKTGEIPQFTPTGDQPLPWQGDATHSTTYGNVLESHGFKIPELPSPEKWAKARSAGANTMQFQARSGDTALKSAAVKDSEGKIFAGAWHGVAHDTANAESKGTRDRDGNVIVTDGFVTNSGEFLDREQAHDRAVELGQMKKEDVLRPLAEKGSTPWLESNEFNEARQFQPKPDKETREALKYASREVKHNDGAPMAFFHGTDRGEELASSGGFQKGEVRFGHTWGPGFYFTNNPKVASGYALETNRKGASPAVIPSFLDLRKPMNMEEVYTARELRGLPISTSGEMSGQEVFDALVEKFNPGWDSKEYWKQKDAEAATRKPGEVWPPLDPEGGPDRQPAVDALKKAGFDGILAIEAGDEGNYRVAVAFDSEQIHGAYRPPEVSPEMQFQGKKKEDLKFQKTTAHAPSKAWLFPDGSVKQLGSQWHHEFMNEHPEFGIKNTKSGEDNRVEAIQKGFGRVNLEPANGRLTVEVRQSDWRKYRPIVERMIEKNLGAIDKIRVNLLDDKASSRPKETFAGDIFDQQDKLEAASAILRDEELPQKETFDWMDPEVKFQPKSQEDLFGVKEALSTREMGDMTKAEMKAHFPEAIVPGKEETIESDIVNSPLARQNKKDPHQAFSDKLVEFANSVKDTPEFQDGKQWYSEFTPMLKKKFEKDAPLMAQLLAATSPRVNPTVNYAFALDALEGFKSGRFSRLVPKFEEGLEKLNDGSWEQTAKTPAEFMANWIEEHNLQPRQSNGQLFGMRSNAVLQVLAGIWLEKNKGPKVGQFVQNLLGTNHEATIDVWADRTMRRLGYEGMKDRWRILPGNQAGVSDVDFAFSQEAFNRAAKKLKMKPSDLQGALWFAEKRLWADRGWGRIDLGDFRKEMEKTDLLRAGIKQREAVQGLRAGQKTEKQLELEP